MFLTNKFDSFPNSRLAIARGTSRLLAPLKAYPGGRFLLGQIQAAIEDLEDHIEKKLPGKLTGAYKKSHKDRHTSFLGGVKHDTSENGSYHAKRSERYRRWLEEQDEHDLHADNSMSGALHHQSHTEAGRKPTRPGYRDARYARRMAHNRKFHHWETDEQRRKRHAWAREDRRKHDRPGDREARAVERRQRHDEERRVWEEERRRDERFAHARRPEPAFHADASDVNEEGHEVGDPFILNFYSSGRVTHERGVDDGMEFGARRASPYTLSDGSISPTGGAGEYSGGSGHDPLTGRLAGVEARQRAAASRSASPLNDHAAETRAWDERERTSSHRRREPAYGKDEQNYSERADSYQGGAPDLQGRTQAERLLPHSHGAVPAAQPFGAQHPPASSSNSQRPSKGMYPLHSVSGRTHYTE